MDALALLCTLHADGPTTLARLRAADCTTLERVVAQSPQQLGQWMHISTPAAARFQREAQNLVHRLGVEEDSSLVGASAAAESATRKPGPLERVLSAWRERDEADALVTVGANPPVGIRPALTPHEPKSASAAPANVIPVGAVDGIDAETSTRLAQIGLCDLRALSACDALATARQSGISYSRLMRLRALAKRAAGVSTARPKLEESPKLSPAERPLELEEPVVRFEREYVLQPIALTEDAGGPFA